MEATTSEPIKRAVSFSAAINLRILYLSIGIDLTISEAREELHRRWENGRVPETSFWQSNQMLVFKEDLAYRLDDRGWWPCLVALDPRKNIIVECYKIGDWLRPVLTSHALKRFIKHSARLKRYFTDGRTSHLRLESKLIVQTDLFWRLFYSQRIEAIDLRNGSDRISRHGESLYSLESQTEAKAPLVFVTTSSVNRKGKPVLVLVTCFPFKGSGASHNKPKSRDSRAREKMRVRRLLKQPPEMLDG